MALYTVAPGDSIWDIADRSLGLQRGTSTAPASVQEIADEMLRIIATNMGKLKVPKGSKGTPGAADLIHAGLVLDLGGAPSPSEAAINGQTKPPATTKPPTDLEQEKTPGSKPTDLEQEKTPVPEYGGGAFAGSGGGQNRPPALSAATLAAQRQAEMSRGQGGGGAFASSGGGQYRPPATSPATLAAQRQAEMSRGQGGGGAFASSGGGQYRPPAPSAATLAAQRRAEMTRPRGGGGAFGNSGGGQTRPPAPSAATLAAQRRAEMSRPQPRLGAWGK